MLNPSLKELLPILVTPSEKMISFITQPLDVLYAFHGRGVAAKLGIAPVPAMVIVYSPEMSCVTVQVISLPSTLSNVPLSTTSSGSIAAGSMAASSACAFGFCGSTP